MVRAAAYWQSDCLVEPAGRGCGTRPIRLHNGRRDENDPLAARVTVCPMTKKCAPKGYFAQEWHARHIIPVIRGMDAANRHRPRRPPPRRVCARHRAPVHYLDACHRTGSKRQQAAASGSKRQQAAQPQDIRRAARRPPANAALTPPASPPADSRRSPRQSCRTFTSNELLGATPPPFGHMPDMWHTRRNIRARVPEAIVRSARDARYSAGWLTRSPRLPGRAQSVYSKVIPCAA